ncbi:MAG: GntR family transcriptional regulator [Saccharospirillum sp.]|uniref:GntR family transcriptional regulator n=1 Tax=Saccharospirillum sp. TaxID=2033801 RepID=UPI003297B8AC
MTNTEPQNQPWTDQELAPIRDKVYSYIKDAILGGEYKAGDRLVERNLAEKLKISRTPIREALFKLESQRFVSTIPRKGVVVNEISRDEILEVFLILSSLETLAVRLAAQKINEETIAEFDREIDTLQRIQENPAELDGEELHMEVNLRYNDLIGKASKNIRLHEMLTELKDYVRAFSNLSKHTPGRTMEALGEHLDILVAVRNGQADLAESYARVHIEKAKRTYMKSSL